MIQKIDWVDQRPHTIILRSHPLVYGQYVEYEFEGKKKNGRFHTHTLLLNNFLENFEYEENYAEIRAEESSRIHGRVAEIQKELIEAQTNPDILAEVVATNLQEGEKQLPSVSVSQAKNIIGGGLVGAMSAGLTEANIEEVKAVIAREHKIAEIKSQWISKKTTEIATTLAKLAPFYEEQAACALAQTNDVREYVEKVLKGIESLDLYIGKNVIIKPVKKGQSAADDIPLSLIQKKLMVDEELAVWLEIDEWFDFSNMPAFFKALNDHPGLVEQIFPTERCILVMATTRRMIDYGDRWTNNQRNAINETVFLMVRDGENIYQVYSPVESHLGASRLFPSVDDQNKIFKGTDGSTITFEDIAYTERLQSHERHALHYKRFLILLCGLDHRENLFGTFYPGPKTLNFVSLSFQEKYCQFIHDDDGAGMLPNPFAMDSVFKWAKHLNAEIRPGSRIVAFWNRLASKENCPVLFSKRWRDDSMDNTIVDEITAETVLRKGNDLIVTLPAKSRYNYGRKPFNATMKINPDDLAQGEIVGLCIDRLDPNDLDFYIHNRQERQNQVYYIQFFKHVRDLIMEQRKLEKPTRDYLVNALTIGNIGDINGREKLALEAVMAWKYANPGKDLPIVGICSENQAKELLNHLDNVSNSKIIDVQKVTDFLQSLAQEPLRICLNGKGNIVAYTKARPGQIDHILESSPFINKLTLSEKSGKLSLKSETMDLLRENNISEKTVYESEEAESHIRPSVFADYSIKKRTIKRIEDGIKRLRVLCSPMTDEEFQREFRWWRNERDRLCNGYVVNPKIQTPIGCTLEKFSGTAKIKIVHLEADYAALLYRAAPDGASRLELKHTYIDRYKDKSEGNKLFNREVVNNALVWDSIYTQAVEYSGSVGMQYFGRAHNHEVTHKQIIGRCLNVDFDGNEGGGANKTMYVSPELVHEGKCIIDELLDISIPEDYELIDVRSIKDMNTKATAYLVEKHGSGNANGNGRIESLFGFKSFSASSEIFTSKAKVIHHLQSKGIDWEKGKLIEGNESIIKLFKTE